MFHFSSSQRILRHILNFFHWHREKQPKHIWHIWLKIESFVMLPPPRFTKVEWCWIAPLWNNGHFWWEVSLCVGGKSAIPMIKELLANFECKQFHVHPLWLRLMPLKGDNWWYYVNHQFLCSFFRICILTYATSLGWKSSLLYFLHTHFLLIPPPVLLGGTSVIFFQEPNGIYYQLHEC